MCSQDPNEVRPDAGELRSSTVRAARRLGWTDEDGHYQLSPRSEAAHKAIASDLEKALSDTNRNGDERNGGVGLADYREPFEESGQDAKLSGLQETPAAEVTVGVKRKLAFEGTGSGGRGTRSRVADALPQGAGGFSPSISWDALKNAVAATSLKQPDTQDGAVYSTSINRRAELTQAKATTVPRIGSVTQNKGCTAAHEVVAEGRQALKLDASGAVPVTIPLPAHQSNMPSPHLVQIIKQEDREQHDQPAGQQALKLDGSVAVPVTIPLPAHQSKVLPPHSFQIVKQEGREQHDQPAGTSLSQTMKQLVPVVDFTDNKEAAQKGANVSGVGIQDSLREATNGGKGAVFFTLVQTEQGFVGLPLQVKAGVTVGSPQVQEIDRARCEQGKSGTAAMSGVNTGAAYSPQSEPVGLSPPGDKQTVGRNTPIMTVPPYVVMNHAAVPRPHLMITSQGVPLVMMAGEDAASCHTQHSVGANLVSASEDESHVGKTVHKGTEDASLVDVGNGSKLNRQFQRSVVQAPQHKPWRSLVTVRASKANMPSEVASAGKATSVSATKPSSLHGQRTFVFRVGEQTRQGDSNQ